MALIFDFNPDVVADQIENAIASFNFNLAGDGGQTLGRNLVSEAARLIAERSLEGNDPNGSPWKPNARKYAEYKLNRYSVDHPGELSGQMLSLLSLIGQPDIEADSILMKYGLGEPPTKSTSRTGIQLKPGEQKATDKEKAGWFTDGGREFFEFDPTIDAELIALAYEEFETYLRKKGLIK